MSELNDFLGSPEPNSLPLKTSIERIFPIRNLVNKTAHTTVQDSHEYAEIQAEWPAKAPEEYSLPPFPDVPPDDKLRKLPPNDSYSATSSLGGSDESRTESRKVTERTKFVPEKHGGDPGVASLEGGRGTFYRCEDEPIHIPGAIQSYGILVALKHQGAGGNIVVRIASENSEHLIGYNPEQLFGLESFCDLLNDKERQTFESRFHHVLAAGNGSSTNTNLEIFTVSLLTRSKGLAQYWCALHLSAGTKDLVICEIEAQDDVAPSGTLGANTLPSVPVVAVGNDSIEAERLKSITSGSQPLRALSLARVQNSEVGYREMFHSMSQAQSQLSTARTLQDALDSVVGIVKEVTQFHRVMVYRFDKDYNGAVVAELVDPRASGDIFRGLSFPAADIPAQARALYKINQIRLLYDRDQETARLVCRDTTDFARPLDLTHSYLRAMSPIHLKYLANMGVRSSMSISIIIDDDLWGLVLCHSYGEEGIRVSLPIRELCRNVGECASINIERILTNTRMLARRPPEILPRQTSPLTFIAASSADLLRTFDADCGMLSIQDEARTIGKPTPYQEALALLAYLQRRRLNSLISTDNIRQDFPDIGFEPGIHTLAGMLFIPLSSMTNDFIVFFRAGQLKEVSWAGNPYEKIARYGTANYLEPRSSFWRWTEKVIGTSKAWTVDQLETASILSLLYGRFIEVWRQKEMAVRRSRMTKLLIQNSSHEVRTPLNAIINYLEIALETNLDNDTRDTITKASKASKSLVYVIDDLLNLTKVEDGHVPTPSETFDLGAIVSNVVSTFHEESIRRELELTFSIYPGTPRLVKGDSARLYQVLSNITSNAFQNCYSGSIQVEIHSTTIVRENSSVVTITIQDQGLGMSEHQLDDLFQEFEQIVDEEEREKPFSKMLEDKQILGTGLAVVARYVRNMNGQIRIRSELGKGTHFSIELPMKHVPGTPFTDSIYSTDSASISDITSGTSSTSELGVKSRSIATNISSQGETPITVETIASEPVTSSAPTGKLSLDFTGFSNTPESKGTTDSMLTIQQKRAVTAHDVSEPLPKSAAELPTYPFPDVSSLEGNTKAGLRILVAEDNPINARMLKTRLEKTGYEVHVTVNGQSCYDAWQLMAVKFDAILMDLQMPLIDGHTSTRMIRDDETGKVRYARAKNQHIPIFAVSASLSEEQRFDYIRDGFDGWVLKPIDFKRLEQLLLGIYSRSVRMSCLYQPGQWERGGWFLT